MTGLLFNHESELRGLEFGIVKWGIKPRPIDPNFQILNTSKIERLGWSPRFDLNSGLSDYVDRLRKIMQKSFS